MSELPVEDVAGSAPATATPRSWIPFHDSAASHPDTPAAVNGESAQWLTSGPRVAAFEEEFAAYVAAGNAVAVASGMTGLELSLLALRLPRRSRVLVSALADAAAVPSARAA